MKSQQLHGGQSLFSVWHVSVLSKTFLSLREIFYLTSIVIFVCSQNRECLASKTAESHRRVQFLMQRRLIVLLRRVSNQQRQVKIDSSLYDVLIYSSLLEFMKAHNLQSPYSLIWPSFAGNWTNDMRHGYGSYHYKNGDIYEGHWEGNQRHGRGTYTCTRAKIKVNFGLSHHAMPWEVGWEFFLPRGVSKSGTWSALPNGRGEGGDEHVIIHKLGAPRGCSLGKLWNLSPLNGWKCIRLANVMFLWGFPLSGYVCKESWVCFKESQRSSG